MTLKKYLNNLINLIYKVNDVQQGFFYWQSFLTDKIADCVKYHDLSNTKYDDDFLSQEIEYRRITNGFCGIVDHPDYGKIPCNCFLYNYDVFGNFLQANFFNPFKGFLTRFIPSAKTIDKDCVVIYSSSFEKKVNAPIQGKNIILQEINRYARLLADIDATLSMYTINTRQPYIITTRNQQTHQSLIDVFKKLKRGEFFVGLDKDILKEATTLKTTDITPGFITELVETKNRILQEFFNNWGITTLDDKKERFITTEVEQEVKKNKINIFSYLYEAEQGIKRYNKLYKTSAYVELNKEIFDYTELYENAEDYEIKEEYKDEVKEEEVVENED